MAVYFRNVDQTDPNIQNEMVDYVNQLESLDGIKSIEVDLPGMEGVDIDSLAPKQVKPFCWVRDFKEIAENILSEQELEIIEGLNLTFTEQMNLALSNPVIREVYGQDIIRDEAGNITASRCWLFLSDIDLNSVSEQIDLLHEQRAIGAAQPVNQNKAKGEWSFFFYDTSLFYWEAFDSAVQELIFTIASGVIALTIIAFVLIPHWTAVLFVTPMILMLYTNFLGKSFVCKALLAKCLSLNL